jgi:hypothetical protein
MADIDRIARSLPAVETGIACAGTSLESRTYKVGGKAFLFVSPKDARLKLSTSAADAKKRGFEVGASLWVKLPLASLPPDRVLAKWIAESHAALSSPPRRARPTPRKARGA